MKYPATKAHPVELTLSIGGHIKVEAKQRGALRFNTWRAGARNFCASVMAPFVKQRAENVADEDRVENANSKRKA